MPSLPAVEPHWFLVFHSVSYRREGLLVLRHWHTDRTNQYSSWTQSRIRDLQASVVSASKVRTRSFERGLCHRVILLFEDELDDSAGFRGLVKKWLVQKIMTGDCIGHLPRSKGCTG